jgi:hypothetical protein
MHTREKHSRKAKRWVTQVTVHLPFHQLNLPPDTPRCINNEAPWIINMDAPRYIDNRSRTSWRLNNYPCQWQPPRQRNPTQPTLLPTWANPLAPKIQSLLQRRQTLQVQTNVKRWWSKWDGMSGRLKKWWHRNCLKLLYSTHLPPDHSR